MTPRAEQILLELESLSEDDRASVAQSLLKSLTPPPSFQEQEGREGESFGEMLDRRFNEMKKGQVASESYHEVIARLRGRKP